MNLFILCATVFNLITPNAQVLSDNQSSTTIQYTLPEYNIENVMLDGKLYSRVVIPNNPVTYLEKGLPELPRLYSSIIINDNGEYNYRIINAVYETLMVNTILPSKGNLTRDIDPEKIPYEFSSFYNESRWFPESHINISNPYILRDFRGLTIHFNPFQYNPSKNQLIVCRNITVQIVKEKDGGTNIKFRNSSAITVTKEFEGLYQSFFLNYSPSRIDTVLERAGRMLVITSSNYINNIKPLVNWKRMKGIPTKVARYPEDIGSGHTAIKNYIQTEFNQGGLVWILIVGDSANVPPARTVGISTNASADPVYTYLEGGDYYPDAFISRFSANSPTDVDNQVARTITYERSLVTGDGWESKGLGVASAELGGTPYADSTRCNWLRAMLLGYNYTLVDRVYDLWGTITMVSNSLNNGRSIVNYIGHGTNTSWSSTGFSNSNVNALTNYNKLPFIISVACVNGNFGSTTCFAEAWLRAGTPANPAGAIAFYGSTINQAWVPPTVAQSAACTLLVQNRNNTVGGLMFNGSCHMIAAYLPATDGIKEFQCWHIFGDASVQVRNLSPQPMTVVHQSSLPIGMSNMNILVSGVRDALVGIYKDTMLYGSGYTDATGNVSINFSQPISTVGNVVITVSAYNKATYCESIPVIIPNLPYVMYQRNEIFDPMPGGNNNGQINPGEAIEMRVWLKNFGGVQANNVCVWIRTTDPNIMITDSFKSLGNILANDSVYTTDGFDFSVATSCTNNYNLQFTLTIKDAQDSTWQSNLSLTVAQCVLRHVSTAVNDPAPGGNNNGILNRGETANLITTIRNIGGATANNVTSILSTTTAGIMITDANGSFGSISSNNTGNNSLDPYTVQVDSSVVPGTIAQFRIIVSSTNYYTDTIYFTLPIDIYLLDFEANNGGFTPTPTTGGWEWGSPTSGPNSAYSGTKCWGTVLAGNYAASCNYRLDSPELTATINNPSLSFRHWYYTETNYDGGNLKIATSPNGPWTIVTPTGGYNGTASSSNVGIPSEQCYMGQSGGWLQANFTLPVTAGQRFYLRWHFGSDGSIQYAGWYIDDVTGIGFAQMPLPNNDVGVDAILSPGTYHFPNTPMIPSIKIKNFGAQTQTNFPAVCSIIGTGGALRYWDTLRVTSLFAGDTIRVNFKSWIPTQTENCTIKVRTSLSGDQLPNNDRKVQITNISPTSQIVVPSNPATTSARVEPLDRFYNYNTHEAIYLQSEIGVAGIINQIGYYKASGSDLNAITPVTIYMKQTTDATLPTGSYSLTGYTQVYNGAFPNNTTEGWMEVPLSTPFAYNNTSNLAILIIKGYQAYISSSLCPLWRYTATSSYLTRGARSDNSQPTSLTQTYNRPNIRFLLTSAGIEEPTNRSVTPIITMLYAPKPNPVINGLAHISFSLAEPSKVSLKIYDASGREVKTLVNELMSSGVYNIVWNGRDDNNRTIAEGIYFYTLETSDQKFTKKIVYTK